MSNKATVNEVQVKKMDVVCVTPKKRGDFERVLKKAGYEVKETAEVDFHCGDCKGPVVVVTGIVTRAGWPLPFIVEPWVEGQAHAHAPGCIFSMSEYEHAGL